MKFIDLYYRAFYVFGALPLPWPHFIMTFLGKL